MDDRQLPVMQKKLTNVWFDGSLHDEYDRLDMVEEISKKLIFFNYSTA
jgi:hypothetical protein